LITLPRLLPTFMALVLLWTSDLLCTGSNIFLCMLMSTG
jgi:hypothetical protein